MARKVLVVAMFILLVTLFGTLIVDAQGPTGTRSPRANVGTGFTYQGQLKNSGAVVNGACNLQFGLWNDASVGTQLGVTQTTTVTVTSGLFTTVLNSSNEFGTNAINGDARWLAMTVRCPSGSGSYTALSSRQALTPTPMAFALPGLYTQQNATSPNVIGGYSGNYISPTVVGGTIAGGGAPIAENRLRGNYASIGGGSQNTADNTGATIGGGVANIVNGYEATIGGGGGNTANGDFSTIGGGMFNMANNTRAAIGGGDNNIASGISAFIGGGGNDGTNVSGNQASGNASTIGGGLGNSISVTGTLAFIGGGYYNTASNQHAAVSGGFSNSARGHYSTIGGGSENTASGSGATISGGSNNTASGKWATIPGGAYNTATMSFTLAAGNHANALHQGTFVWGDSTGLDLDSTANNQFLIRAGGGVGINSAGPFTAALSVNGQVVAGGIAVPSGSAEPFVGTGINSGISLNDRAGGANPRWVMYPNNGILRFWNGSDRVMVSAAGKITATGGFNGQCLSAGNFSGTASNACNMDVAEGFAANELTEPGDLVALVVSASATPTVRKSSADYDELLVGVVSQNPGLVFDNGATHLAGDNSQLITADKTIVALIGRVNVKVSMENGVINIGDALTSSSRPGVAMKATQAGKIIGYALESVTRDGTALTLLQPGFYLPADQLATVRENTAQQKEIADLHARLKALEQTRTDSVFGNWWVLGGFAFFGIILWRQKNGGVQ